MVNAIEAAFAATPRQNFVPPEQVEMAGYDTPLPIGYDQTISQPTTVRLMLEWLDVRSNQRVLDVGSGSGWTSALLSRLVGDKGKVLAVERIPELVEFGRQNCQRLGIKNVEFRQAGKSYGLPLYGLYDRILVSASAEELPTTLIDQLKRLGKLVIPVRETILEITKTSYQSYKTIEHPGFVFVPLV